MALIEVRSSSSSETGRIPELVKSATQSQASLADSKTASAVRRASGRGSNRSMHRVITPNIPSLPISRLSRWNPVAFLGVRPPELLVSPVGVTKSSPSTNCFVLPYLTHRGPPAFSAMLPPMNDSFQLDGSGG